MLVKQKRPHVFLIGVLAILGLSGVVSIAPAQEDTWIQKAPMPTPRNFLSTSVVNGKIYAIGGTGGPTAVEEYDPATDTWTRKNPMPTEKVWTPTSAVNGKIYAIGGVATAGGPPLARVDEYDPATDTWTSKAPMPTARFAHSTSVVEGIIYAVAGWTVPGTVGGATAVVEAYDPVTDTWSKKTDIPTARLGLSTNVVNGKIYAIGGANQPHGFEFEIVHMYDPVTNTWTNKASMPRPRATFLSTSVVNGIIYVVGGIVSSRGVDMVDAYDPATDTWTEKTSMPTARGFLATSVVNSKIYAIGGARFATSGRLTIVEEYTPVVTSVEDAFSEQNNPAEFVLFQNYPNPFNPVTTIRYQLTQPGKVVLKVYNTLGREIKTLVDELKPAGSFEVSWNGRSNDGLKVASGVYLYQIEGPGLLLTKKMVLLQ